MKRIDKMTVADKLNAWADIVEAAPREQFKMSHWCDNLNDDGYWVPPCKTTFCAGGWLASSRFGKRLGLSLDMDTGYIRSDKNVEHRGNESALCAAVGVPVGTLEPVVFASADTKCQVVARIRALAKVYAIRE